FQMSRKSIYTRNPHTVKTTGNFVTVFVKFTTRSDFGHYDLQSRFTFFFMHIDRNSPSVVSYRNGIAFMNGHINSVTVTSQSLVNGVVHYFVHQMMKTSRSHIPDVHRRTHTYVLNSL